MICRTTQEDIPLGARPQRCLYEFTTIRSTDVHDRIIFRAERLEILCFRAEMVPQRILVTLITLVLEVEVVDFSEVDLFKLPQRIAWFD